ncbi:MAG TPA: hypothetical protein PKC70_17200, partial [Cellvibrionaceae bacterium]|nr:hypothetical protein [Cellvibrionaceae bacterium]
AWQGDSAWGFLTRPLHTPVGSSHYLVRPFCNTNSAVSPGKKLLNQLISPRFLLTLFRLDPS